MKRKLGIKSELTTLSLLKNTCPPVSLLYALIIYSLLKNIDIILENYIVKLFH